MSHEEDFVGEEPIEVEIDGRKFKIKEILGFENDLITNKYVKIYENNRFEIDIAVKNREWLKSAVVDAPYEKNGKPFRELGPDERLEILQKLKPALRAKLLKKVAKINEIGSEVKKK